MAYLAPTRTSLGHVSGERWTFDESVTHVFEDMLRRSIPQYDVMRRAVFDLGSQFVTPNSQIVDLGCARGEALAGFVDAYAHANRYLGVDASAPMIEAAQARFAVEIDNGLVRIVEADLRGAYPAAEAGLTLCVLTLQFTPPECRQRIVDDVYRSTVAGGALILVEKIRGATPRLDRLLIENYYALKAANGYTMEEIQRKRLSLEGVLVPMTSRSNEDLLASAGFEEVDCFWRWMNFAGWVAVKRGEPQSGGEWPPPQGAES